MATTSDSDLLRVLVYGGSTRIGSLSTDDINSLLDNTQSVWFAASHAAGAEASKLTLSGGGRKRVGDLEIDTKQAAADFRTIQANLRRQGLSGLKGYAGGVTRSSIDAEKTNSERPDPVASIGQFDNPGSTST